MVRLKGRWPCSGSVPTLFFFPGREPTQATETLSGTRASFREVQVTPARSRALRSASELVDWVRKAFETMAPTNVKQTCRSRQHVVAEDRRTVTFRLPGAGNGRMELIAAAAPSPHVHHLGVFRLTV